MIWSLISHRRFASGCAVAGAFWLATTGTSLATPPAVDLFTNVAVQRLLIELPPDALESLRRDPRKFVSATVSEETNVFASVAVHLKGKVGSFRPVDDKPGLTLDFSRFINGRKFHGLRRIHLNNSVEDPSYLNEKIGSELFLAAGVPTPRVAWARVELNGRDLGLYVLKEGFTEDFLAFHFKQVGGDLFEPDRGQDIDQELKRNSVAAPTQNGVALKALAAATLEPDSARRWQRLIQVLDTDRFVTFMAMEVMLGHRDGYCLARNNFRVYHDLDTGKVVFFPSGMDQLFGKADLTIQPSMAGLVAKAVMETPEGKQRYRASLGLLLTNVLKVQPLTNRVNELVQELRPFLSRSEWPGVRDEATSLEERIGQRQQYVQTQLSLPARKPLEFVAGIGRLTGWQPVEAPVNGRMDQVRLTDGMLTLHISTESATAASWRTRAILGRGHYRFEGRGKVAGVKPLPQGLHQGAELRVAGRTQPVENLTGDSSWKMLDAEFNVEKEVEDVEFICELRAAAGEAWFDLSSLNVVRLP